VQIAATLLYKGMSNLLLVFCYTKPDVGPTHRAKNYFTVTDLTYIRLILMLLAICYTLGHVSDIQRNSIGHLQST
jgi:hypothetical protein